MNIAVGTQFGRYEILAPIGAGGMGEVYLAQDTKLKRKVALKLLLEKYTSDGELLQRFIQEAIAASALNHPNIITVYEIGESDGTHFIATEYIEGETLRDKMKKQSLSLGEKLDVMAQTAEALSVAHQAGIIHRDIKPDNIMIRHDGYVKILDFGLAKLVKTHEGDGKTFFTQPGFVMGTPHYMSPEQARGVTVDGRTDVWSLGVVLYELLSGKLPFVGETITDVLAAIISNDPPPLSGCPAELANVVDKTLRKSKSERYDSAKELVVELKKLKRRFEFEESEPHISSANQGQSSRGSISQEVSSSSNVNKDSLLLTEFTNLTGDPVFDGTLKMALAISLEQSPFLHIFSDKQVRQTLRLMGLSCDERVTREIGSELCQRRGLKAYITGTISNLGTLYVITLEAINALTDEPIARLLEQAESKEQVIKALGQAATGLREKLGESLSSIEKFDAPLEVTTSSLEALKLYSLGFEQARKGKYLEDIPFLKQAIELDPNFAFAYAALAMDYSNTNQPKPAAECAAKAFELRDRVTELERLRITYYYYSNSTGEIGKAIETLEEWKQKYPRDVSARNNLSHSYARIGQYEKGLMAVREALQMDSNSTVSNLNLASLYLSLNRFDEVKEVCLKAIDKKIDNSYLNYCLYQVAFIGGDKAAMSDQLAVMSRRADEYYALEWQAATSAFRGEWRQAEIFSRRAIDLAALTDAKSEASFYAAEQAIRSAVLNTGLTLPKVKQSLELERNQISLTRSALALALSGEENEIQPLLDELNADYPKDTLINDLWLPTIISALEFTCGEPKQTVELLETVKRYEHAAEFYPQYIRGLAYLKLEQSDKAFAEFQKILKHRGESPSSVLYTLAYLGAARALMLKGNAEKAQKAYNYLFFCWQNADDDLQLLIEAKKEFENVK
jgi:serine/threonine protein kinase/Tfp pilus assembly protein PilF